MRQYIKKPIPIEAIQYDGTNYEEIMGVFNPGLTVRDNGYSLSVFTFEGEMLAVTNDWIAKGVEGELYVIRDRIFKKSYDPLP